jgi:hypothetical protein
VVSRKTVLEALELAGIAARDERLQVSAGGSVIENDGDTETWRSAVVDRRRLLVLLRETRNALAALYWNVTDEHGERYVPDRRVLKASAAAIDRLAAIGDRRKPRPDPSLVPVEKET